MSIEQKYGKFHTAVTELSSIGKAIQEGRIRRDGYININDVLNTGIRKGYSDFADLMFQHPSGYDFDGHIDDVSKRIGDRLFHAYNAAVKEKEQELEKSMTGVPSREFTDRIMCDLPELGLHVSLTYLNENAEQIAGDLVKQKKQMDERLRQSKADMESLVSEAADRYGPKRR